MAKTTLVSLVDDLDGSPAQSTIEFSFKGKDYVIDLSDEHAAQMEDALSVYISAARKPGFSLRGRRSSGPATVDTEAVRRWARVHGHQVADRGRIPGAVLEAYSASHY